MFNLFCKHHWKVLSETTTESQLKHVLAVTSQYAEGSVRIRTIPDPSRKLIQLVTCNKCGRLNKLITLI